MTRLDVSFVSIFPESTRSIAQSSILGRAIKSELLAVHEEPIRDHAQDKHKTVDDSLCGGGPGQLMRVDVVKRAIESAISKQSDRIARDKVRVILPDPAGPVFTQSDAERFSAYEHLVFVCGRYEGIDARIYPHVDEILSLGDYVVTGGELGALVMFDAIARCVPGVLGNEGSKSDDSHQAGLLAPSQYTRPVIFDDAPVPEVLLGGNHAQIEDYRLGEQLYRTEQVRPDLFAKLTLSAKEQKLLEKARALSPYHWQK